MIEDIFDTQVISYIKEQIKQTNGSEVFFVGTVDEYGIISGVKTYAKGNKKSVPVIFKQAYKGDCIIHNHPSGNLEPSNADISIASQLANDGIGFIIVNNTMDKCYTVVGNMEENIIRPLDSYELLKFISKKGPIAKKIPNYEQRESQELMLENITYSFNNNEISLIEAGTGTGKSLAYLIPSIIWAVNNKEKVVVSTNTINLQQQLMNKDIPLLKTAMGKEFTPILVKGSGNYICLKKLNKAISGSSELFVEENEREILEDIVEYANHKAKEGSRDELGFIPSLSVWEKVNVETDICTRAKCFYFNKCFFFKARKAAVKADLLIVNHHLLCSDISIRKEKGDFTQNALLPTYHKLIIDEAHNLEDVATSYFGNQVTRIGTKRLLNKLYNTRKGIITGILPQISYLLEQISNKNESQTEIQTIINEGIFKKVKNASEHVETFFDILFQYTKNLNNVNKKETKIRLKEETLENGFDKVRTEGKNFANSFIEISKDLNNIIEKFDGMKYTDKEDFLDEIKEITSYYLKISGYAMTIEEILSLKNPYEKVYWIEMKNRENSRIMKISSCPLDISIFLQETIFGDFDNTVVMTSATLTSNKSFHFIKERIGLNDNLDRKVNEVILPSVFDYENQMSICIPMDVPEPKSNKYLDVTCEYLKSILDITQGSTFLLFTSFFAMDYVYNKLSDFFANNTYNFLKQGTLDRHLIITRFKNDPKSVLFGTDSFWEGVDVTGDSLRCVIIMKLPFRVPTEPIIQARIEKMERENINSFMKYTVPQTVIKFRQGFGRLIRSKKDTGCVICLDRRVATKPYGKIFLESLPPAHKVIGYYEDILSEIRKYFN